VIVTCEKCHTKFEISKDEADNISDKGRILKCGNCHHMWLANKVSAVEPTLKPATHSPTDSSLIRSLRVSRAQALTLRNIAVDDPINDYFKITTIPFFVKLSFYTLLFFVVFVSLIIKKDEFLAVPPLRPVLATMGLSDTSGLEFEKVTIVKSSFELRQPLIIAGFIVNKSDEVRKIPDIRIRLLDKRGEVIDTIVHDLPSKKLEPGEKSRIANRIQQYPRNTYNIEMEVGNYLEFLLR